MFDDRIRQFVQKHHVLLPRKLGDGKDGLVLESDRPSAVKFCNSFELFAREGRAYQAVTAAGLQAIRSHQIPQLLALDHDLWAIEMSIVAPPFLLDFASSYTQAEVARLAFSEEVMVEREMHWAEIFEDRWGEVVAIREAFLRETGLVLLDLSLNNVRFE